jgi:hypothetical protein
MCNQYSSNNKNSQQVFAEINLALGIKLSYLYLLSQHIIHGKAETFMLFFHSCTKISVQSLFKG